MLLMCFSLMALGRRLGEPLPTEISRWRSRRRPRKDPRRDAAQRVHELGDVRAGSPPAPSPLASRRAYSCSTYCERAPEPGSRGDVPAAFRPSSVNDGIRTSTTAASACGWSRARSRSGRLSTAARTSSSKPLISREAGSALLGGAVVLSARTTRTEGPPRTRRSARRLASSIDTVPSKAARRRPLPAKPGTAVEVRAAATSGHRRRSPARAALRRRGSGSPGPRWRPRASRCSPGTPRR